MGNNLVTVNAEPNLYPIRPILMEALARDTSTGWTLLDGVIVMEERNTLQDEYVRLVADEKATGQTHAGKKRDIARRLRTIARLLA